MMYKLIYESPGGNEAPYPVRDSQARFGKDTYGKIRLQVHQLRQYYFHDYIFYKFIKCYFKFVKK